MNMEIREREREKREPPKDRYKDAAQIEKE